MLTHFPCLILPISFLLPFSSIPNPSPIIFSFPFSFPGSLQNPPKLSKRDISILDPSFVTDQPAEQTRKSGPNNECLFIKMRCCDEPTYCSNFSMSVSYVDCRPPDQPLIRKSEPARGVFLYHNVDTHFAVSLPK